jgi:hypothetical protein
MLGSSWVPAQLAASQEGLRTICEWVIFNDTASFSGYIVTNGRMIMDCIGCVRKWLQCSLMYCFGIYLKAVTQTRKNFSQHSRCPSLNLNQAPPKYKSEDWRGRWRETVSKQKLISTTLLPCTQNQSNVGRILMQNNIKTTHLLLPETHSILRPVKDIQGVAARVYTIPR